MNLSRPRFSESSSSPTVAIPIGAARTMIANGISMWKPDRGGSPSKSWLTKSHGEQKEWLDES